MMRPTIHVVMMMVAAAAAGGEGEPVQVATVLGAPTVLRRETTTYMTGTKRVSINGTNFRAEETSFVFDPPLYRDVDYVMEVESETVAALTLKTGRKWRSDGEPGPLKVRRVSTGAASLRLDKESGGVTVAVVRADYYLGGGKGHGVVTVETTPDTRLYQSSKTLTISGSGFDASAEGANTLRWANSLRGPKGADLEFNFAPEIDQKSTFTVKSVKPEQIVLELKKNARWPVGALKILSLRCAAKDDFTVFAEDDGVAVAQVLPTPTVEEQPGLLLYSHHSTRLIIRGSGFAVDSTSIVLSPAQDPPPFTIAECLDDFIALELNDGASWVPDDLLPPKGAAADEGVALKVQSVDTGAGPVEFDGDSAPAVAAVVNEPEGDVCDDSCEYANDGTCDDGSVPFMIDDDYYYQGPRVFDDFDDIAKDDDNIYGYGDEYTAYFDRASVAVCAAGTDCTDCQPRAGDGRLAKAPAATCANTCIYARDHYCDDGRDGLPSYCDAGTDCQDCGPVGQDNYTRFDDDYWDDDGQNFYFHDDYWDDYDRQYWGDDDDDYYGVARNDPTAPPSSPSWSDYRVTAGPRPVPRATVVERGSGVSNEKKKPFVERPTFGLVVLVVLSTVVAAVASLSATRRSAARKETKKPRDVKVLLPSVSVSGTTTTMAQHTYEPPAADLVVAPLDDADDTNPVVDKCKPPRVALLI